MTDVSPDDTVADISPDDTMLWGDTVAVVLGDEQVTIVTKDDSRTQSLFDDADDPSESTLSIDAYLGELNQDTRQSLTVGNQIAVGGMSRIYQATDNKQRRVVVMKTLDTKMLSSPKDQVRFLEEAQITGQLDHPNIPPVHDLWLSQDGEIRFTMKLVRGRTLSEIISEKSPLERSEHDLAQLLEIFMKVCDAVSFAHSRGVIHRDLKPANVMVGSHGQVYVMDWGCALIHSGTTSDSAEPVSLARDPVAVPLEPPGVAIGTPSYMAPEQIQGVSAAIDERTDIYLLGGIMYEILTHKSPHRRGDLFETLRHAKAGIIAEPQEVVGDIPLPPALVRIAMRALAREPADRYDSVAALKDDVEQSQRSGLWFGQVTFEAGTLIIREGDEADAAYIITEGACEAFRVEAGQRVSLRRMGPGDAFGETAIFTLAGTRTANVEAVEATTAIVVTRASMERAVAGSWLGPFIQALAERFREHDETVAEMRRRD